MGAHRVVSVGLGCEEMAGFCEHGKELIDSIKNEEFLGRRPTVIAVSCRQIACKRREQ